MVDEPVETQFMGCPGVPNEKIHGEEEKQERTCWLPAESQSIIPHSSRRDLMRQRTAI